MPALERRLCLRREGAGEVPVPTPQLPPPAEPPCLINCPFLSLGEVFSGVQPIQIPTGELAAGNQLTHSWLINTNLRPSNTAGALPGRANCNPSRRRVTRASLLLPETSLQTHARPRSKDPPRGGQHLRGTLGWCRAGPTGGRSPRATPHGVCVRFSSPLQSPGSKVGGLGMLVSGSGLCHPSKEPPVLPNTAAHVPQSHPEPPVDWEQQGCTRSVTFPCGSRAKMRDPWGWGGVCPPAPVGPWVRQLVCH